MKYTIITLSVLLCLIPGRSYSWFSPSGDTKPPGFTMNSSSPDISSNIYVLHYNTSEDGEDIAVFPGLGNSAAVFADRINIDIPLIILSKEAIDPGESLDRLLAANLRIQNILDEYLAFKKRTGLLLKDLGIPYLEKPENKIKTESAMAGEVLEGKKFKKDIENIIRHGAGYNRTNYEQIEQSVAAIHQIKQTGTGVKTHQQQGNGDTINRMTGSAGYQKLPVENIGKHNELPWIFRFILGILKHAYVNKLEIVLWSVIVLMSILIVTLVVKR